MQGSRCATLGLRMAVDGHIGKIGEKLGGMVLSLHLGKELRRRVDETRRIGVVEETLVADDGFKQGEVRRHTADTEFAQHAVYTADRLIRLRGPGRDLFQQRILIAGNDGAAIGGATIRTNVEAGSPKPNDKR